MKKIAVILSGCGVGDGTEIHEACAALLALDRAGVQAVCCAPSGGQMHVMDHLANTPTDHEERSILTEAARIARGDITPLASIPQTAVDAVLLPGGFGAAKNLSTFAVDGASCTVHPEVAEFLTAVHKADKPIGAMCISPVILARIFGPDLHPRLTIGSDPATAAQLTAMGAVHVNCGITDTVVDTDHRFVTTPAYMLDVSIGEVFTGAARLVDDLLAFQR